MPGKGSPVEAGEERSGGAALEDGDCRVCGEENGWTGDGAGGEWFDPDRSPVAFPCGTLKLLALPYADHADFDPAWIVTA